MPHKLRNFSRHKFKKTTYKITNCKEYNQALINRGAITFWGTVAKISANQNDLLTKFSLILGSYPEQIADETILFNNIFTNVAHLTFL